MKRTFVSDFRQSNPRLHALYVQNALQTLGTIDRALEEFDDSSLVDAAILAGGLREARAELVRRYAHYWDAAAMLYVGVDWLNAAEGIKDVDTP